MNQHLETIDPELIRRMIDPMNIHDVFKDLNKLPSIGKYFCIHIFAMYLAEEAGRAMLRGVRMDASDYLFYAMLYEAFSEHFLQDSFASGHQRCVGTSVFLLSPTTRASTISIIRSPCKPLTCLARHGRHM